MRKLLNTLYVTSPDSYVSRDGTNVVVTVAGSEVGRLPVHNIQQVVAFGYTGVSPGLMRLCNDNGVTISFLSPSGRFIASFEGEVRGNVLLRRMQYRVADDIEASLEIARNMISAKVMNCVRVVKKGFSNHPELSDSHTVPILEQLVGSIDMIRSAQKMEELRGLEGDAARRYFILLDKMILKDRSDFYMRERTRRPPRDRFNALLSFTYALLMNDVKSALNSVGLDPYVGFMHADRPGRPSLALDMMEELRPMADRLVLRMVNLRIIQPDDFIEKEGGAFLINDDARRKVIEEWQTHKTSSVYHGYIGESVQAGMVPFVQAMLMARNLRGEISGYVPYIHRGAKE